MLPAQTLSAAVVGLALLGPTAPRDRRREFDAAEARLTTARATLVTRFSAAATEEARQAVREEARQVVVSEIVDRLFPLWLGKPWAMEGTASRPDTADGTVACGYFVAAVLENAGLRLQSRIRLSQAPALSIQRALVSDKAAVHRFVSIPPAHLAREIAALGEGLYIIGLNIHVGFVVVRGGDVRFVHASYTGAQVVTDEPLAEAEAIALSQRAGYFVSPVFQGGGAGNFLIDRWLQAQAVGLRAD